MSEPSIQLRVLESASRRKMLLSRETVSLLAGQEDFESLLNAFETEKNFMPSREQVGQKIARADTKVTSTQEVLIEHPTRFHARAKEVAPNFRILKEFEVTPDTRSSGKITDFLAMFVEKYQFLSGVLRRRAGLNPKSISRLKTSPKGTEVDLVAMVSEKWITKNGHLALRIEDPEGDCIAVLMKNEPRLFEGGQKIMLDDMLGIKATKVSNEMVIVKEFFWPDLQERPIKPAASDLSALIISDIHCGSKLFMKKEFQKFLSWLNGQTDSPSEREQVSKIKYLFVAGDNIDGIGVYPGQFEELEIKDLYEQYGLFEELMLEVPEYIEVFICPGQHDAVRRADPQPPIPAAFVPRLSQKPNFHFLGSPGWVEIEGLTVLMYHGASLYDLYASLNISSYHEPHQAIIELLKRRDLMAAYGLSQPYVPHTPSRMLIREEPDLYVGGDMHHTGYGKHKSCLILNSGTWQERTPYQVAQGLIPTTATATQIELSSRRIIEHNFGKKEETP
ncbi:MAG: metallophosphoesterase [Candidatus Diapherotrites archaeon]|nr:metallophosphoesterase [Candidatus Diapherotrites archaeon]